MSDSLTIGGVLLGAGILAGAIYLGTTSDAPEARKQERIAYLEAAACAAPVAGCDNLRIAGGKCLCLTSKDEIDDEIQDDDGTMQFRVCNKKNKPLRFLCEDASKPLKPSCEVLVDGLRDCTLTIMGMDGDLEKKLSALCRPCIVSSDSWGHCPECAINGNCKELCQQK